MRRWVRFWMVLVLSGIGLVAVASGPSSALGTGTELVTLTTAGGQLTGASTSTELLDMTPNGQHVLFASNAPELGVPSGSTGVFVRDRLASTTSLVGTSSSALSGRDGAISDDGRWVVARRSGTIQLHDRLTSTTTSLGTPANQTPVVLSGDGSTVGYTLSTGVGYVRSTTLGAPTSLGTSTVLALSEDGRFVARSTSSMALVIDRTTDSWSILSTEPVTSADLSADGTVGVTLNTTTDEVWRWSASSGRTRISTDGDGVRPSISADGTTIAFGTSGLAQVWTANQTEPAPIRMDGATVSDDGPITSLSEDGRYVAFVSSDTGLAPGDVNGARDVFLRDRLGPAVATGDGTLGGEVRGPGGPLDGALVTVTGRLGTFTTLTGPDGRWELAPVPAGLYRVAATAAGHASRWAPSIGTKASAVPILLADGEQAEVDVTLPVLDVGPASRVSRGLDGFDADRASSWAASDAAGRYVAFASSASNLVPGDTNGVSDVFVADRLTGSTSRVSLSATGEELPLPSVGPSISDDGRTVAFVTASDGVVAGVSGSTGVYVRNLDTWTTVRANVAAGTPATAGDRLTALSGDGAHVAYQTTSSATQWVQVPVAGGPSKVLGGDAYLGVDGTTTVSQGAPSTRPPGRPVLLDGANFSCTQPCSPAALSRDGRWMAYSTDGQTVQVRDLETGTTTTHGTLGVRGSTFFTTYIDWTTVRDLRISDGGRYVAFTSIEPGLDGLGDTSTSGWFYASPADVWVLDTIDGSIQRATIGNDRSDPAIDMTLLDLSADGRTVLVKGLILRDDANDYVDIVAIDLDGDYGTATGNGSLTGTVTDVDGDPIAGIVVQAFDDDGRRIAQATTAPDGRYSLVGLPGPTIDLGIEDGTNLHYAASQEVPIDASPIPTVHDVVLEPAPAILTASSPPTRLTRSSVSNVSAAISSTGRYAAFLTTNRGLVLRDRVLETERQLLPSLTSIGAPLEISDDGQVVALLTTAKLDAADTDTAYDAYLVTANGSVTLASDASVVRPAWTTTDIALSPDGSTLAFIGDASGTNAIDAGVYRFDRSLGTPQRIGTGNAGLGAGRLAIDGSGERIAYGRSGSVVVARRSLATETTVEAAASGKPTIGGLSDAGDRLVWSDGAVRVTDLSTSSTRTLRGAIGSNDPLRATLVDVSGDGDRVLIADNEQLAPNDTSTSMLFVHDIGRRTITSVAIPSYLTADTRASLSGDGNVVVSTDASTLWVGAMPGDRVPSAPSVTLAGPSGDGAAVVWDPPIEHPSALPTTVEVRRFEDGTLAEVAEVPFNPDFGLWIAPSVTPGSVQRFEVRLRNEAGLSAPGTSEDVVLADAATIETQVRSNGAPVPYTAVVAFRTDGVAAAFTATGIDGNATLRLQPGTYRLRAFVDDTTPSTLLDGWSGGGPLAAAGEVSLAAGETTTLSIEAPDAGTVTPLSQLNSTGRLGGGTVAGPDASSDGRWFSYVANGAQPVASPGTRPPLLRDAQDGRVTVPCALTGSTTLGASLTAVSDDGRYVAFASQAGTELARCDRQSGLLERLETSSGGTVLNGTITALHLSGDGGTVAFTSTAANLVPGDSTNADAFVWRPDAASSAERLTTDVAATASTSITSDGSKVAVLTTAGLVASDTFGDQSLYVIDTTTGAAELASRHPVGGSANATRGEVSADGTASVFASAAPTLTNQQLLTTAYHQDLATGTVTLASTDGAGRRATGAVSRVAISGDGERVAFTISEGDTFDVRGAAEQQPTTFIADVATGSVRAVDLPTAPSLANQTEVTIELDATGDAATFTSYDSLLPGIEVTASSLDAFRWTATPRPAHAPAPGDQTAPVLTLPPVIVVATAPGDTSAAATWTATAVDASDGTVAVTCDRSPGTFPVGTRTVTCAAEDAAGNVALGSFPLTVVDRAATDLARGSTHTCALLSSGEVTCWGSSNASGQLGRGTVTAAPTTAHALPQAVALPSASELAAGNDHTCARLSDGGVRCWGANGNGQLGDGTTATTGTPTPVAALPAAEAITARGATTCTLHGGGTVRCWGANASGQLGSGSTTDQVLPTTVVGLTNATQVVTGGTHTCALLADTTVRCWGANSSRQLGDGTTTTRTTPVAVAGLSGVAELALGSGHTCARLTDGTVRCWGLNSNGQLGDGSTLNRTVPVTPSGLTDAVELVATATTTCARRSDGSVACWGANANLLYGTGIGNRTTPTVIGSVSAVDRLRAGPAGVYAFDATPIVKLLATPLLPIGHQ